MSSLRLVGLSALMLAALVRPAFAAESSVRLLQSVPAGAPFLMHVRNIDQMRAEFARSPYAGLWSEPEVQAFFAPTIEFLNSPDAEGFMARFEIITGHRPLDLFGLFTGEMVLAVMLPFDDKGEPLPQVVFGGSVGGNRAKLEAALKKASESNEAAAIGSVEQEELQGETIHTFFKKGQGTMEPKETISWALIDDVVWFGHPKAAIQGMVASFKNGGAAEPITASAGFAPIYGKNPAALGAYYIDVETLVRTGMTAYQAHTAAKQLADGTETENDEDKEEGEEGGAQPSMFEQMGLTPDVIVHALGVDALRSIYMVSLGGEAMVVEGGLNWSEQRGILKMFAFGNPPAPQPAFVSPQWPEVSAMRFSLAGIWEAIKDSARTANPMFEFMLAQQLAGVKEQTGIDVEKDFFGALGDEAVFARTFLDDVTAGISGAEQLWATSLTNAEAFGRVLDTALAMVPNGAQMFEEREYLGHKIRSITSPMPGAASAGLLTVSFAVTPGHLFIDIGGTAMVEAAIQRLGDDKASFWTQPAVVATLKDLPGGSVGVGYQDAARAIHQVCLQLAQLTRLSQQAAAQLPEATIDEDGRPVHPQPASKSKAPTLERFINPDAVPSHETVARHLGTTATGIYLDADGIRFRAEYRHAP